MVENNWSVSKIKREAALLGEPLSESAIASFKKHLFIATKTEYEYFDKNFQKIDEMINELEEYAKLIKLQKTRIDMNLKAENKVNISIPETRKNIELLKTLVQEYVKIKQMLGVIPTPVGRQTFVTKDTKNLVFQVMKDQRNKILGEKDKMVAVKNA